MSELVIFIVGFVVTAITSLGVYGAWAGAFQSLDHPGPDVPPRVTTSQESSAAESE